MPGRPLPLCALTPRPLATAQESHKIDRVLRDMSSKNELDRGFFEHLQWEVDEQKTAGNQRLLKILEVVVQRACLEVERGAEVGRRPPSFHTHAATLRPPRAHAPSPSATDTHLLSLSRAPSAAGRHAADEAAADPEHALAP